MAGDKQVPSGPQHPLGYYIGGDSRAPHHPAAEFPVHTEGEGDPSEFQAPSGQILGDHLPLKFPEDFAGATDNAMGGASLAEIRSGRGFISVPRSAAASSTNPDEVDGEASPRSGFLGRSHGSER